MIFVKHSSIINVNIQPIFLAIGFDFEFTSGYKFFDLSLSLLLQREEAVEFIIAKDKMPHWINREC